MASILARRLHGMPVASAGMKASISCLRIHPKVQEALDAKQAVVALESTIISHGMPYPQNVETAVAVEEIISAGGAQPATIAIMNGYVHVGLGSAELEALGKAGKAARKVSRRDFASCVASGQVGATTVSGTMVAACMAGIHSFVTGGIGGVHRGVEQSMDVSADLTELGRTPVAVISAGVKSILDIPKTLEYLETQGVPVMSLTHTGGPHMDFPAFFSPTSGVPSPHTVRSVQEAAEAWAASLQLGLQNGMLLAVPTPHPAEGAVIQRAVDQALAEAGAKGVEGRDVTPFLLARVAELTGGKSLEANIALVKNNARVGAAFACAVAAALQGQGQANTPTRGVPSGNLPGLGRRYFSTSVSASRLRLSNGVYAAGRPVVLGGSVLDVLARVEGSGSDGGGAMVMETSNPGQVSFSHGGVGRNIAEVLTRLGTRPALISYFGADTAGDALASHLRSLGCTLHTPSEGNMTEGTPTYVAVLDGKADLVAAVAGMSAFSSALSLSAVSDGLRTLRPAGETSAHATLPGAGELSSLQDILKNASIAVMDANAPGETVQSFARACSRHAVPCVYEPISVAKCTRALPVLHLIAGTKPNQYEVEEMAGRWREKKGLPPLPASRLLISPQSDDEEASATRGGAGPVDPVSGGHAVGRKHASQALHQGQVDKLSVVMGSDQADGQDDSHESRGEDYTLDVRTLAAAQSVLAAMLCPSGLSASIDSQAVRFAQAVAEGVGLQDAPGGEEILREVMESAGPELASVVPGLGRDRAGTGARAGNSSSPQQVKEVDADREGALAALLEGRKHVWVSLGKDGLLWLSARVPSDPARAKRASDLCATLPFFLAAQHPAVAFDYAVFPAVSGVDVKKVTGAGDTLVGCTVWALSAGMSVCQALHYGMAGAVMALEGEPREGAVPRQLTGQQVLKTVLTKRVKVHEHEYS